EEFPVLEEFFTDYGGYFDNDIRRIKSMVSAPRRQQTLLKVLGMSIRLYNARLWEDLIRAIDLLALEELHFNDSGTYGFTQEQLKVLVDHVADYGAPSLPLRLLNLNGIPLHKSTSTYELFAKLRKKVPEIKIVGVDA
ncbi:hypothetical protein BGX34_006140, partial [Mortierella sp. NVP85]